MRKKVEKMLLIKKEKMVGKLTNRFYKIFLYFDGYIIH